MEARHIGPHDVSSSFLLVLSPEHSIRSPASRTRIYSLASRIGRRIPVIVLPISAEYWESARVNLQLLSNTLVLFSMARSSSTPLKVLVQRGTDFVGRILLLVLWRRLTGQRLIFDFDDAIYLRTPTGVRLLCTHADAIIASTQYLASYASMFNRKVAVVPTLVDLDVYTRARRPANSRPVIGWIGTPSNLQYLRILQQPLKHLQETHNYVFRIVTDERSRPLVPLSRDIPWEIENWEIDNFVEKLRYFDVGVCPLPDDDWTRGKAGYKILEYMALEVPPVASSVGFNKVVIEDGFDGFLVSTENEWWSRLKGLIEDPQNRERMGQRGRSKVENGYSLQAWTDRILDFIKSV